MSKNSVLSLRNLFIYQIYLRNYNQTGTFQELITDLDRIKGLGVDIIYLLPIHPVGQKHKKGSLGSNYSISDYRAINPELGTFDDLKELIEKTHQKGMKLMLDVIFHHTAHDSILLQEHPEWFFYRNGKNANKVGDWDDIIDLDFEQKGLWEYLIETLEMYVKLGVDGYRCDVAPLIPLDFWIQARERVNQLNPNFIWLSESVHKSFIKYIRDIGFTAQSDGEMYNAFDMLYDYDIHGEYMDYLNGKASLKTFLDAIRNQETIYPANYTKLRNLENHDQPRIADLVKDKNRLTNLTAFIFFVKGATMIYAGQEAFNTKRPSLFDIDKVDWSNYKENNCDGLIKAMATIKKDPIMANGIFNILDFDHENVIVLSYRNQEKTRYGLFNVSNEAKKIKLNIPNGEYTNLIDHNKFRYEDELLLKNKPMVFDSYHQ